MPRTPHPLLFLIMILGARGAAAVEAPEPSAEVVVLRRCALDYERASTLGSALNGVVQECLVEPGATVKAGQVLGRLRDEDARAEVHLRESEAGSDIEIRLGEAKRTQALNKARKTGILVQRNAASLEEYNFHKLEAEVAGLEVEQARHRRSIAEIQLRHARAMLREREFTSPHDGVVVAVLKRPGEPVTPHDPIFRVVAADSLLVVGQADITDAWRLRVGQPVRVIPEVAGADLAIEREAFTGRVVFVDAQVDPVTQTCKVVARVANPRGLLRAGIEVRMELLPTPTPAPAPAPPPAVAQTRATAPPIDRSRTAAATSTPRP